MTVDTKGALLAAAIVIVIWIGVFVAAQTELRL